VSGDNTARGGLRHPLRRIAGILAPTVLFIIGLEIVLRLGTFVWHDFSQYYLFYGFHELVGRVGVSPWSVYSGEHYKFPPGYQLQGAAGQGAETAQINSLGFRGPDFEASKPPDTFRIITLGGSSTFGFHNSDTGTYPFQLQQRLLEPVNGLRIEVLNAGFPYYTTATIRSLLEEELVEFRPDLLTLYTAYNDASWPLSLNPATRLVFWLQQHSIIYLVMKETVLTDQRIYKIQGRVRKWFPSKVDTAKLDATVDAVADRYRENVEAIISMARDHDIAVVLIRQPMTTRIQNSSFGDLTYKQEYEAVRNKIAAGEFLSPFDIRMIIHYRLVEELDAIGREYHLPMVDNIAIVDADRTRLTTWVHLTEEANGHLADALQQTLLPMIPQGAPTTP